MNCIHFECAMGAAGDMLCAALFDLCGPEQKAVFVEKMNALFPGVVSVEAVADVKQGIAGTRIEVSIRGEAEGKCGHDDHEHDHGHHSHRQLNGVVAIIDELAVSESVKRNARDTYMLIARAESRAHGRDVEAVHFHEVGMLDAIADVVGFSLLVEMLHPGVITASPVHVGMGKVSTSHGVLPVPAPATAFLLSGVPTYSNGTEGELCTPTGAALLKHFCDEFLPMPPMRLCATGYGMGKKDFPALNCVRAFLGEKYDSGSDSGAVELRCNIDDMTPEAIGYAVDALMASGVMDVFVQHATMKKNRPGFMLVCLCAKEDAETTAELVFKHTSTIGIRRFDCGKYLLARRIETIHSDDGTPVRLKTASGFGTIKTKLEYDDIAAYAKSRGLSFEEATRILCSSMGSIR